MGLMLVFGVLVGCSSSDAGSPALGDDFPNRAGAGGLDDGVGSDGEAGAEDAADVAGGGESGSAKLDRPVLRFGLTGWTGSRVVTVIAEQLVELQLGYPVELVEVGTMADMLDALASSDLDAVVEVWPSTLDEADQAMIDGGRVVVLGELGPVGGVGWFVPRWVVEEEPSLATWEGFLNREVAGRFAVDETAPAGRFLGTDPSYEQYDEDLIEALGLPFEVVYSGSEDETRRLLAMATDRHEPILLYWWSPTAEIKRFDLVAVSLPERDSDCLDRYQAGGPMSCAYPADALVTVAAPDLAVAAPDVAAFLAEFSLSTEDQIDLIYRVEVDGDSLEVAARAWIEANRTRWQRWVHQG